MRPALLLLLLSGCATWQPIDCVSACMPLAVADFRPEQPRIASLGAVCRCADREFAPPPPSLGRPPARDTFATRSP